MLVATTYPGVYIQEKSSGVRTITGVSTSVTAFLGTAASGPINKAVHVQGFAAFETAFGGLVRDSEMGYAVQQFFANGGADAWVVRVAGDAVAATLDLLDGGAKTMLTLTALTDGAAGNNIEVQVDYDTA